MKKVNLIISLFVATLLFSQTTLSSSIVELVKQGIFSFESETIDYGTIEQNSDGNRTFVFTNTGDSPITITKVIGSCGCTVPTAPTEAILPGEKGEIKVRYDTKRTGVFNKSVKITSNAETSLKIVHIKGKVIKSAPAANANN